MTVTPDNLGASADSSGGGRAAMTRRELLLLLQDAGIRGGDVLLVHSSLRAIGPVDGGADGVIDTLLEAIGPAGLLAVPTHTWATVSDQQPVWHEVYSPSTVGTLTNLLRARPGAVRSLHPTHSVAAIGPRAAEFCAGHENDDSPCSPTSPYGRLIDWKGKVVLLGVDLTRCTFFHCLEEVAGLGEIWSLDPVRRRRYLITADGRTLQVMSRGHKDYKSDNYFRIEPLLLADGVMVKRTHGTATVRVVDAAAAADWLVPRLRAEPRLFW